VPGQIVILNGAPRAGKSCIAGVVQESFDGNWVNLAVDIFIRATPSKLQPGIGLRPGGERPDLEAVIPALYASMYDSIAAHSRHGVHVVVDVGHHDSYTKPLRVLSDAARRLGGLPVLFVGVRCPIEVIMQRRDSDGLPVPAPVRRWQVEVHRPGIYDLEIDTSTLSPEQSAALIRARLRDGPPGTAFFTAGASG
jgi:chloramphenicol 3-O phosphotransferase